MTTQTKTELPYFLYFYRGYHYGKIALFPQFWGFSKRKIEVGIAYQTGGDRNLRWKPDLTQDLDTDLVRPNKQAT